MNCSGDTARDGFELFCSRTPPPPLDQLNGELIATGRGAVSHRMYRHYRKLSKNGFSVYIPINELDVQLKHQRAERAERSSARAPS